MTESLNQDIPATVTETIAEQVPSPVISSRWQRLRHWEYLGLLIIVLFTLVFHFIAITKPGTIIWDEKWYVGDARSIVAGGGDVRSEHPALGKLFIVAGEFIFNGFKVPLKDTGATLLYPISADSSEISIYVDDASIFTPGTTIRIDREHLNVQSTDVTGNRITVERDSGGTGTASHARTAQIFVFTDNAFGWRFFPVLFGTLGIIIFFLICRKLGFSLKTTLIATFLFALEDMTFIHSSLALLDVFMVTFMLAAVLLYLNESYLLSGVFVALSAQCKLAGVLIFIALFLHFVIYRREKWLPFVGSLLLAGFSFVLFTFIFELLITGNVVNPADRIYAMLNGTANNDFTVPKLSISSYPWTWIYPQFVMPYYNSPNVPFLIYSYEPQYISFISSTIQIVIVPTIGYMIYKAGAGSQPAGFVVLWFLAVYVAWIPLVLATNRVTFVFYFLSATPAICIGVGMAISDILGWLKNKRERAGRMTAGVKIWYGAIGLYLLIHLAIFVVFNPAIPPIIKTWLPPFSIGVDPTAGQRPLITLVNSLR
jgi:dolichyl-phosphate-mannose-protein mannosyltransferase